MGVLADWQKDKPQTPAFAGGMTATNPNTPAFADAMGGTNAAARGVSNLQVKAPPPPPETPATPVAPTAPAGGGTTTPPAGGGTTAPKDYRTDPYWGPKIENAENEIFRLQNEFATYEAQQMAGMGNQPPEIQAANMAHIADARGRMQQRVYELQQKVSHYMSGRP